MRLFNQTKNQLRWDMNGALYECEPWGPVELPDELVAAAKSRGLPLDLVATAPEIRAHERIADERAVADQAPLLALRKEADEAKARETAAVDALERCQADLASARRSLIESDTLVEQLQDKLRRMTADKDAAEKLFSEASAQATESEARAIKAEALLSETKKQARPDKPKST